MIEIPERKINLRPIDEEDEYTSNYSYVCALDIHRMCDMDKCECPCHTTQGE